MQAPLFVAEKVEGLTKEPVILNTVYHSEQEEKLVVPSVQVDVEVDHIVEVGVPVAFVFHVNLDA